MLVVTRKENQSLFIRDAESGEVIEIVVVLAHGAVKLGIEASRRFVIHREEAKEKFDK